MSPEMRAARVADVFERIHREQMAGLPLLNGALSVTTLGFHQHEGRTLGMLITPWMMSLLLFPGPADSWQNLELGGKHAHAFPGGTLRFMVNLIVGLGACQMHSVHSPMQAFRDQAEAMAEASSFLGNLLAEPPEGVVRDPVDEELLGRILRGEKVPELEELHGEAQPASRG